MVDWKASVARIRTTHHGSGRAYGIVTGMGEAPTDALAALEREAEERAAKAAEQTARHEAEPPQKTTAKNPPAAVGHKTGPVYPDRPQPAKPAPAKPQDDRPWHHVFEVVDVHLTPAVLENGRSGWLAYGTLAWEVGYPWQAGTTGARSGSPGRSQDDRGASPYNRGGRGGREGRETR